MTERLRTEQERPSLDDAAEDLYTLARLAERHNAEDEELGDDFSTAIADIGALVERYADALRQLPDLAGDVPEGHAERPGLIRAAEFIRSEAGVPPSPRPAALRSEREIRERLARIMAELGGGPTHSRLIVLYNRQQALAWVLGGADDGAG